MSISMHKASAPVFLRMLGNLDALLDKAEKYAKERNFDPNLLVTSRLAPDMRPLSAQVQFASDTSKFAIARLSGGAAPPMADTETTIAELRERIKKTVDYIKSVPASAVDGSEEREVVLKFPNGEMKFTGLAYLTGFVLPNFLFHVTTAYAILRHNGVPLGKGDFLGNA
ncbi:MAG TPA: DUF1993 domain-containing protein [Hyphomonadaceae bacterium]|nr:DUF1993 domain-containing protein [Hyphomonadaceae bacterium]HPI47222.1 DUF1993 domain-containing protein [Hyphomonadaceae bacterium]